MTQLNLFDGVKERDKAINRVSQNGPGFMATSIIALAKLPSGEYTGEDIRVRLINSGISPHHSNAWGALIMQALRIGLLKDTGRVTKMKTKTSHARKTSIYNLIA